MASSVEERLKLLFQTDYSLGTLFGIRKNVTIILDKLDGTLHKNSWKSDIILESLTMLEKVIRLESIGTPFIEEHADSGKVFHSISKSLEEINKKLRLEHTKAIFLHSKAKARDECYIQWRDLLDQLVNHKFFYSGQIESGICKELDEILNPLVMDEQSKFIRDIPTKLFTVVGTEDPYEHEDELLDKVIVMRDPGISFLYQLTFRYFSTPDRLFTELCTRFCTLPLEVEQNSLRQTRTFKELVLEFFLSWIHNFYYPDIHQTLHNDITTFVNDVVCSSGLYF